MIEITPIVIGIAAVIILAGIIIYKIATSNSEDSSDDTVPDSGGSGGTEYPDVYVPSDPNRAPTKRALLVGINIYDPSLDANLSGCVNDVDNMRSMLINTYGFNPDNIRVLTDTRATKAAIIERLQWLVYEAVPGDVLVFHYSGHGSQVRDRHGDELDDGLDEILCPTNLDWDDPLTDDIIGEIFSHAPANVTLIMISDSCHSGTITKELICNPRNSRAKFILPPFDIRCRTLDRPVPKITLKSTLKRGTQRHILLSGCKDDQTSADALIDGKYQGALTWALTSSAKATPDSNWVDIHKNVLAKLSGDFTQTPQLSGDQDLVECKIFGGTC